MKKGDFMKKIIVVALLVLCSSFAYAGYAPGDPPCNGVYPFVKADKTRDQVKYGWYNKDIFVGSWPARQAACVDWFYIWQPGNWNLGYYQQGGYVFIADSSWFGFPGLITYFNQYGKTMLLRTQPWYDYELNIIIQKTAELFNNRGVWWGWA